MPTGSLMKVESIAECSLWSILQYFWPALSDNGSWKLFFGLFESGHFTQVLLYCELLECVLPEYYTTYMKISSPCTSLKSWNDNTLLTLSMLGNFSCFCCLLLTFFKIIFIKSSFRNIIRVSNSLDSEQVQCLSDLIWVQTVCKGYQQTTLMGKE